jgi:hypothetical protein
MKATGFSNDTGTDRILHHRIAHVVPQDAAYQQC